MSGNTFGRLFRITTYGESHNNSIGVVIDGVIPNIKLDIDFIKYELDRRKPGGNPYSTKRKEPDVLVFKSGLYEGYTTGCPICIEVENKSYNSSYYDNLKDFFRPGHADYTYYKKYVCRDHRGGGRSSGRETVARVIAGAVAKQLLRFHIGLDIYSYSLQIGDIKASDIDLNFAFSKENMFSFPDKNKYDDIIKYLDELKSKGDSAGGIVRLVINNVPGGLGEPVFDKLDADLSKAVMSIGGIKGISFGSGFDSAELKGSENNDPMRDNAFVSNNCGGILGGISTGEDIVITYAVKPTPSIRIKQSTIDKHGTNRDIEIEGYHDTIIVPRLMPVAESMTAITLLDHYYINLKNKAVI